MCVGTVRIMGLRMDSSASWPLMTTSCNLGPTFLTIFIIEVKYIYRDLMDWEFRIRTFIQTRQFFLKK